MSKNNHRGNVTFRMSYEVEALRQRPNTDEFRSICKYQFSSTATSEKSLKDIVRRDLRNMGFRPHRIIIKNCNAGFLITINCRQS